MYVMICHWSTYADPHSCLYRPTEEEFDAFQSLLNTADKERTHKIDDVYTIDGEYHEVDDTFYACPKHTKKLKCSSCKKFLTRHQIHNFLNSDDYNHDNDRYRNFGKESKALCTTCCLEKDFELRSEVDLDEPICFSCGKACTQEQLKTFHELLDKADEENTCDFVDDSDYMDYDEKGDLVDNRFYACKNCIDEITCCECGNLLRRHDINNYRNSRTLNHLNEGLCVGPACCKKCDLRNEGYEVDTETETESDSDTNSVLSKASTPKPSRNTMSAAEIPLPPSPTPMNSYNEFFVQQHPGIKAANPTWTPQQITTEIGRRWSLQQMSVSLTGDTIIVIYAKKKYTVDGCSKGRELCLFLEAYREKKGHEALLKLVEMLTS